MQFHIKKLPWVLSFFISSVNSMRLEKGKSHTSFIRHIVLWRVILALEMFCLGEDNKKKSLLLFSHAAYKYPHLWPYPYHWLQLLLYFQLNFFFTIYKTSCSSFCSHVTLPVESGLSMTKILNKYSSTCRREKKIYCSCLEWKQWHIFIIYWCVVSLMSPYFRVPLLVKNLNRENCGSAFIELQREHQDSSFTGSWSCKNLIKICHSALCMKVWAFLSFINAIS